MLATWQGRNLKLPYYLSIKELNRCPYFAMARVWLCLLACMVTQKLLLDLVIILTKAYIFGRCLLKLRFCSFSVSLSGPPNNLERAV